MRIEALGSIAVHDHMSLLRVTGGTACNDSKTTGINWDFSGQPGYMVAEGEHGRENWARTVGTRVINTQMGEQGVDGMTQLGMESKGKYNEAQAANMKGYTEEEPQRGLQSMVRDRMKSLEGGGS